MVFYETLVEKIVYDSDRYFIILQCLDVYSLLTIDRNENAEHFPSKILMGKKKKSGNE